MKHILGRSRFLEFIGDWGDAMGGFIAGYGVNAQHWGYLLVGGIFIGASIFIRNYLYGTDD